MRTGRKIALTALGVLLGIAAGAAAGHTAASRTGAQAEGHQDPYTPPPVHLEEKLFAFGDNTADVSIRACIALQERENMEEAASASVDRSNDPRFPGSAFGSGGGTSSATYGLCAGTNIVSMALADLDGDGYPELIAYRGTGDLEIWWNDLGKFTRQHIPQMSQAIDHDPRLPVRGGATTSMVDEAPYRLLRAVAIIDVDGDGRPDIVLTPSENRSDLRTLRNLGERRFEALPSILPTESLPGLADSVAAGDLNGDGIADLVYSVRTHFSRAQEGDLYALRMFMSTGRAPWFEEVTRENVPRSTGIGPAGFALAPRNDLQTRPYQPFAVALGDLNGNGHLDVWAGADQGISRLFENVGGGRLVDVTERAGITESMTGMGARLQDLNGDGLLDIVSTEIYFDRTSCQHEATDCGQERGGNRIYINQGGMRFREAAEEFGLKDTGYAWGFSSTDLNGDGYPDMFVGVGEIARYPTDIGWTASFHRPYLMLGGEDRFTDRTGDVFRSLHMPGTSVMVASADITGDLRPDIIVNGRESSEPHLLVNRTPTGTYATLLVKGAGPGGSPTGGEGATVTIRTAGRPPHTFTVEGWVSNYRVHGNHLPLPISVGPSGEAEVTVNFPSGARVTRTVKDGQRAVVDESEALRP